MNSTVKRLAGAAVLVGVTALVTGRVVSQYESHGEQLSEEMQKWLELAKPGKVHQDMAKRVGSWTYTMKSWHQPGSEPEISTGTSEIKSILGGRFIIDNARADKPDPKTGGEIFQGMGLHGFDNATQKYVFAWVDNMGTMIMTGEGTPDSTGKVVTYMSECTGPENMKMQIKSVCRTESNDRYVFEMFSQDENQQWFRMMELTASRKRATG